MHVLRAPAHRTPFANAADEPSAMDILRPIAHQAPSIAPRRDTLNGQQAYRERARCALGLAAHACTVGRRCECTLLNAGGAHGLATRGYERASLSAQKARVGRVQGVCGRRPSRGGRVCCTQYSTVLGARGSEGNGRCVRRQRERGCARAEALHHIRNFCPARVRLLYDDHGHAGWRGRLEWAAAVRGFYFSSIWLGLA